MATFHDRTVAPKFQRGLLRSAGTPCRVLTSAEVVDVVEATEPVSARFGENPDLASAEAVAGAEYIGHPDMVGVALPLLPAEPDTAAQGRALHARRALAQAAEHGVALLAALCLPRLVGDDFVPLDPVEIGAALDRAIATLDALDGDADLEDGGDTEPSLGWSDGKPQFFCDYQDCELDTADWEPSLATPEHHPEVSHCSAPWSYIDRGPDSSQLRWAQGAQHDGEVVNEDGDELDVGEHDESDKEPSIGWPNDYKAVLSPVLMADHDPEEVNEDGDDCGEAHAPWWDRIGYPSMEMFHV